MTFDRALQTLYLATVTCLVAGLSAFCFEQMGLFPMWIASTFFLGYFAGLGTLIVWAVCYAALDVVKRFK